MKNDYKEFYFITFDLNMVSPISIQPKLSFQCNSNFNNICFPKINKQNNKNNICLQDCFNKYFLTNIQNFCQICNLCTLRLKTYIFAPPNVLTFVLNNNKDGNFIIQDEFNLSYPYIVNKRNYNYCLISMLCKLRYNEKYIIYCYNLKDSQWYYYTEKEGGLSANKTSFLDPNAIPCVLFYQNKEILNFIYNKINLEKANNKAQFSFRFQDGNSKKLFFDLNITVKEACNDIAKYFKYNKVMFLIKGEKAKDNDLLYFIAPNPEQIIIVVPM